MVASRVAATLPQVQVYSYDEWPDSRSGEIEVQFRLVYQGRLLAASRTNTRSKEKHVIRKALHTQLVEFWKRESYLSTFFNGRSHLLGEIANNYARCGFRFVPLIGHPFDNIACALDILFLRRDEPGRVIQSGGDLDNRIKVLFDALKMPQSCDELSGATPADNEDPFFCLLLDDKLITEVKITTDRLLTPPNADEHENDVHLIIHVRTLMLGGNNMTAFLY